MARLAKKASRGMILYRGVELRTDERDRLVASQELPMYTTDVRTYPRIRFGKETFGPHPCSMCGALPGDLHTHADLWMCPYERCPFCYVPGEERSVMNCGCREGASWRNDHNRPEEGRNDPTLHLTPTAQPFKARVPGLN